MMPDDPVDAKYYEEATPRSLGEKLLVIARDRIYLDFLKFTQPTPDSRILDVGVSDVVGDAANVLERKYHRPDQITAVGLGAGNDFVAAFPAVSYRRIAPGQRLPFPDGHFDIATSNAVLEHVGSDAAQLAFIGELMRVAQQIFVSVPNRFFPVEHHTALPFAHWSDLTFGAACKLFGKKEWADPANLILMSAARLRRLVPDGGRAEIGTTGIRLGPLSSNLFLHAKAQTA